jgi:aarF domain-containing kinase
LGGYWTKIGQQASVNPAFPLPFQDELKKLQDQMPPSPIEEVLTTLREEFGKKAADLRLDPAAAPLGVASIGQVHRATWRAPGSTESKDIVVKVQHRGSSKKLRQDMGSAWLIALIAAKIDPEGLPDMRPILAVMREVTLNELDFRLEAANQVRAAKTVKDLNIDVFIPEVVTELVGRRAMAMEYVDGVGLGSIDKLPEVNRERAIASMVDHYAAQFAIDGHFNADPHPGNLMIKRDSGQLVVLDWGMCITMQPRHSEAYARLFYAAATSDLWALIDALKIIGLNFKTGEVFEPHFFMIVMRFAVRDSQPMMVASDEVQRAMQVGDDLYNNGPGRYKKSPVDVFTGDMLYLGKALELLYMVSCKLNVNHPILQTLFRRSYARLLRRHQEASLPQTPHEFLPALQQPMPAARNAVENDLHKLLREFYCQGQLLGAQLCLVDIPTQGCCGKKFASHILADFALGAKGWLDLGVVTPDTLFNLLDISKLIVSIVVLQLIDKGILKLEECLSQRWPGLQGKASVTVEHVLSHTAGLWNPLPCDVTTLEQLLDFEKMLTAVGDQPVAESAGKAQRYHHMSFGYLCAGICRHFAKKDMHELWADFADHVNAHTQGIVSPRDLLLQLAPEVAATRDHALIHKGVTSASLDEVGTLLERFTDLGGSSKDSGTQDMIENCARSIFGREHLVDLSLFAREREVPCSFLPGLQAFGNARAVAAMLHTTAIGSVLSPDMVKNMTQTRSIPGADSGPNLATQLSHVLRLENFTEWGLGVQLVRPVKWNSQSGSRSAMPAWGHLSQSGSAALVLPGRQTKALALLVNMVDASETHHVAWAVLRLLEQHDSQ